MDVWGGAGGLQVGGEVGRRGEGETRPPITVTKGYASSRRHRGPAGGRPLQRQLVELLEGDEELEEEEVKGNREVTPSHTLYILYTCLTYCIHLLSYVTLTNYYKNSYKVKIRDCQ